MLVDARVDVAELDIEGTKLAARLTNTPAWDTKGLLLRLGVGVHGLVRADYQQIRHRSGQEG
jgi:hypothetical protein